ncbi:MAG: HEAT repeat domain-containing protein [Planctomycetaceae bacterium]|nr:HEAT repeat domain-containing protein [Planctomycetaceae bacterium]
MPRLPKISLALVAALALTGCQNLRSVRDSFVHRGDKEAVSQDPFAEKADERDLASRNQPYSLAEELAALNAADADQATDSQGNKTRPAAKPYDPVAAAEELAQLEPEAMESNEPEKKNRFSKLIPWMRKDKNEVDPEESFVTREPQRKKTEKTLEVHTASLGESVETIQSQAISETDELSAHLAELNQEIPEIPSQEALEQELAEMASEEKPAVSEEAMAELDAAFAGLMDKAKASAENTQESLDAAIAESLEQIESDLDPAFGSTGKPQETLEVAERAVEAVNGSEELSTEDDLDELISIATQAVQKKMKQAEGEQGEFPWAGNAASQQKEESSIELVSTDDNQLNENVTPITDEMPASTLRPHDSADVQLEQYVSRVEKKVHELQIPNMSPHGELNSSSEVLQILDEALASTQWQNANSSVKKSVIRPVPNVAEPLRGIASLLRNSDANLRVQGIRAAYERGGDAVNLSEDLTTMLNDPSDLVRVHAAGTLYQWNQSIDAVTQTLADVLRSDDNKAVQIAAMYLGDMTRQRDQIIPELESSLTARDGMEALYIAESLLKHDPQNTNALLRLTKLLQHPDPEVRWLTAHSLGSVQGKLKPYAVEALRDALRDPQEQVRCAAALSLGGLGNHSPAVLAELNFMSTHGTAQTRDAATIALDCIRTH